MPTTYTSGLRMTNQPKGGNANTWGDIADDNFEFLDDALTGRTSVDITGGASQTLNANNGVADEARAMNLYIFGTPTSANSVIIPASEKMYIIMAAHASVAGGITVRTNTGAGQTFFTGEKAIVYCDGTSVHVVADVASALDPSENLADLEDVSAARDNLGVYSSAEIDNIVSGINADISALTCAVAGAVTTSDMIDASNAGVFAGSLFYVVDEKVIGTGGGVYSSPGNWITRDLTTVKVSVPFGRLDSNKITLVPGSYLAEWDSPAYALNVFTTRLLNFTTSAVVGLGTSEYSPLQGNNTCRSFGFSQFVVTATSDIGIQFRAASTLSQSQDLGVATNIQTEVYSRLKLWKTDDI